MCLVINSSVKNLTSCAITAYKALNGILCVYKPTRIGLASITGRIKKVIARGKC